MERSRETLFLLFLLFLPTQLGRHFWPDWAYVLGLRIDYLSPTLYLTDLLLFLLFFTFFPKLLSFLKENWQKAWFWIGMGFLAFLLAGIVRSKIPAAGFYYLARGGELAFLTGYLTQTVKNLSQVRKIILVLSGGMIWESLLALGQFLKQGSLGGPFWWLGERTFTGQTPGIAQASLGGELFLRPYGTFSHPNALAGYLVVVLALILGTVFYRKVTQGVKWLAAVSGALALLFTLSRLAWVVGLAVLAWWFLFQKRWLLFFGLIFFLILSFGLIESRFQTLSNFERESWQRRQELNSAAWGMFKSSPFWGVGLGNFLPNLPKFHQEQGAVRFLQPAHNLYFMVGAETGFLGLAVFLGSLFLTGQRLLSHVLGTASSKKQFSNLTTQQFFLPLLIALSAILTLSLFDHYFYTLQQTRLLLALILGLAWSKIKDEEDFSWD